MVSFKNSTLTNLDTTTTGWDKTTTGGNETTTDWDTTTTGQIETTTDWNTTTTGQIETTTDGNGKLEQIIAQLTDKEKDELFKLLEKLKKSREDQKEGKSEKLINSVSKYFNEIINETNTMANKLYQESQHGYLRYNHEYAELFSNWFKNGLFEFNMTTLKHFNSFIDKWNSNEYITYSEIRADIQHLLSLEIDNMTGLINQVMIFVAYSRVPIIKNQMEKYGIDLSLLESICSNITEMLNEINIKLVIPSVLTDKFDKNLHDYNNRKNIWINVMFNDIHPTNYDRGTIYEIMGIGYEIKDEEGNIIKSKKPRVFYYGSLT